MSPDAVSLLFPDRPIRPLPKRRLRERLSPEVASSIQYPSYIHDHVPLFYYPSYTAGDGTGVSALTPVSSTIQHHRDDYKRNSTLRRNGVAMTAVINEELRGSLTLELQPIPSTASSMDGYESFENTNNKKKRKIPTTGDSFANNGLALGADINVLSTSMRPRSPVNEGFLEMVTDQAVKGYLDLVEGDSGDQAMDVAPCELYQTEATSGPAVRKLLHPNGHRLISRIGQTGSGIISTAIATAEKTHLQRPENGSLLQPRVTSYRAMPASTQFTFTCESQTPGAIQSAHKPRSASPAITEFTNCGSPKPKKSRSRLERELVIAARSRRQIAAENYYHSLLDSAEIWICEFCEYERIFGEPPRTLIRDYEIKDRRHRQEEADRKRLLEKAKAKNQHHAVRPADASSALTNERGRSAHSDDGYEDDYEGDYSDAPPGHTPNAGTRIHRAGRDIPVLIGSVMASAKLLRLQSLRPDLHERAWVSMPHPSLPLIATAHGKNATVFSLSTLSFHSALAGGHSRSVRSVAWKPGLPPHELCLVTGSFDSSAGVWRWAKDGDESDIYSISNLGQDMTTGPAGGSSDEAGDWDYSLVLEGHDSEIKCCAFSPSGAYLATCSRDKSIWIWEDIANAETEEDWETIAVLNEHEGDVKAVAWCPDVPGRDGVGQRYYSDDVFASASYDNTARIWREDSDREWVCVAVLEGHGGTVWGVEWEPRPRGDRFPRLLTFSADGTIRVWTLEQGGDSNGGTEMDSSATPHDRLGGIPSTMRRSFREEWSCTAVLPRVHSKDVYSATWSAESGLVASTGSDGTVALYRENTGGLSDSQAAPGGDATGGQSPSDHDGSAASGSQWQLLTKVPNAHGPYEINHITWCRRYDAGSTRKGEEEMLVTTGDDGVVQPWQVDITSP
ncbi:cytosolic iron-sulfur protein assembly protein 1 [Trichoderma cornu-damae]|uniref:Probable cytosolic iron-sulfur protein assembly protein 1 n=1 Tax=Trichoderma cornu-damae TaxID=654480 RepID=A0A9P8TTC1_9HYPO|nr:cytosolic iron-sulfur protein assembly protein 1 [Trichoderma cornu-damae]